MYIVRSLFLYLVGVLISATYICIYIYIYIYVFIYIISTLGFVVELDIFEFVLHWTYFTATCKSYMMFLTIMILIYM